ncbi:MAG: tyrosine-type recombinase/integrase, partial [Clostridia bacterium]|nr:tyrosine-type recombinase/integrase [Clostridia bacterium]
RGDAMKYVFVAMRKPYNQLTTRAVEDVVSDIGDRSGIGRHVHPHMIRHTTATDALDRGMDLAEVQQMLGHSKPETTLIYAKVNQENVRHQHNRCIV